MPEPRPDGPLQRRIIELEALLSEALERERVLREALRALVDRVGELDGRAHDFGRVNEVVRAEDLLALSTPASWECAFHECTNPTPCPEHEAPAPQETTEQGRWMERVREEAEYSDDPQGEFDGPETTE